jgi:hypothetical protein
MRKVSEYEAHATECREMSGQMKDPLRKKQLEDMAEAWTQFANERRKQLAKEANTDSVR